MLEAIRNLGILKMIQEFPQEFTPNLKEVSASLKGTPMLGFLGTFSVNFEIPDYWGIGGPVLNLIQDRCRGGLEPLRKWEIRNGKLRRNGK